jgi:hypothetical protein
MVKQFAERFEGRLSLRDDSELPRSEQDFEDRVGRYLNLVLVAAVDCFGEFFQ